MPPLGNERRAEAPRFKTLDKDEARRGREETSISLRKDKRNEQLQKKRFGGMHAMPMMQPEQQSVGSQVPPTSTLLRQPPSVGASARQEQQRSGRRQERC